mgnify:CR=1 FL=1
MVSALLSSPATGEGDQTTPVDLAKCVAEGPAYYGFGLFTTRNVPGTGLATGSAEVSVTAGSPFSVSLSADGSYVYDLQISLERMRIPVQGHLVAWITTPEIDHIEELLKGESLISPIRLDLGIDCMEVISSVFQSHHTKARVALRKG